MTWPLRSFAELVRDVSAGNPRVPQSQYGRAGRYPVVDQGSEAVAGYVDDEALLSRVALPTLVFGDHTRRFKYIDSPFAVGADGVKLLQPSSDLDTRYAFHFFRSIALPDAGYSRHFKFLKDVMIPLPPIPEQRRIAAILDEVDKLQSKRCDSLRLLETARSVAYLSIFGDPVENPRRWVTQSLGSLAIRYSDGPFGSNLKSEHYASSGVRVIRLQNIGVGRFLDGDQVFVSDAHAAEIKRHVCLPGDVLIGTLGEPNLRACLLPASIDRAINKADVVQLRVDSRQVLPEYLIQTLNSQSVVHSALRLVLGQTRGRISMGRLRDFEIPVPPLEKQREFVEESHQIDSSLKLAESHLAAVQEMFLSLQNQFLGAGRRAPVLVAAPR